MTKYELWSVLGQWAGTIATTLAVIVALWASRLPYSKKIRISFNMGYLVGVMPSEDINFIVTATNIGQRDIQISMIGLLIEDKQFFIPSTINECQKIIKTAESVSHYMLLDNLKQTLIINKFKKNSKIYAFSRDNEGKQYKKYIKQKVKDIISKGDNK